MFMKMGENSNIWKDGAGQNTNVLTDRAGIPVFIKIGPMFERMGPEY